MFSHIVVPFDLVHADEQNRAVVVAADMAKRYGAKMTLLGVSGGTQGEVSASDAGYAGRLEGRASEFSEKYGVTIDAYAVHSADPGAELDRILLHATQDMGADLVVMGTHHPHWTDYIVNSHGGRLASHAPVSVFVVRDPV